MIEIILTIEEKDLDGSPAIFMAAQSKRTGETDREQVVSQALQEHLVKFDPKGHERMAFVDLRKPQMGQN